MAQKNRKIYLFTLLLGTTLGSIAVILLYILNWDLIIESYNTQEGALGVVLIISSRILIVAGMAFYTFFRWFKQEEQYLSDIPFLLGLFFMFLVFGKTLDMFVAFIFFPLNASVVLVVLKIRYFIMILDFFPMIYLSSEMILFSLSLKPRFSKYSTEKVRNKISLRLIIIILLIESIFGMIAPNSTILSIYYPIIVIPSLLTIVWLFYFAYKNKRLSQVNTLILTIGFGLYLVSQIIRPLAQYVIGESAVFLIFAETIDLIIFIIIFIGFYKGSTK